MLQYVICPKCGAKVIRDSESHQNFCKNCGQNLEYAAAEMPSPGQAQLPVQAVPVAVPVPYAVPVAQVKMPTRPNVFIHYTSIYWNIFMVTRESRSRMKLVVNHGQTACMCLTPGMHRMVIKIGNINHARDIIVPTDEKTPVVINASFTPQGGQINVNQPPYNMVASPMYPYYNGGYLNGYVCSTATLMSQLRPNGGYRY